MAPDEIERYDAALADQTLLDPADIAEHFGVGVQRPHHWRNDLVFPHPSFLPPADEPGPRWRAGTVREWGERTGRLRWDGTAFVPQRLGPLSSMGRVRQRRAPA